MLTSSNDARVHWELSARIQPAQCTDMATVQSRGSVSALSTVDLRVGLYKQTIVTAP